MPALPEQLYFRYQSSSRRQPWRLRAIGSGAPGSITRRAADIHGRFLITGEKTCIDCHKGIAHKLPDMSGVPGW